MGNYAHVLSAWALCTLHALVLEILLTGREVFLLTSCMSLGKCVMDSFGMNLFHLWDLWVQTLLQTPVVHVNDEESTSSRSMTRLQHVGIHLEQARLGAIM